MTRERIGFDMLDGETGRAVNVLTFAADRGSVPADTVRQVVADLERTRDRARAHVYGEPTRPDEEVGL